MEKSRITNCYIVSRREAFLAGPGAPEAEAMFREDEGGHLIVNLDGYAIVPLEDYGKHTRRMHKAARVMGYRRDSDTRPKDGDAKQGSTRE